MRKKSIAILACSNGLGHITRVMRIVKFLRENGYDKKITIFSSEEKIRHLLTKNHYSLKGIAISEFRYPADTRSGVPLTSKGWLHVREPNLDAYDYVWSDNYADVLRSRPDTFFTGSFFWHEVLEAHAPDQFGDSARQTRLLLKKIKPLMAGNEYLSTNEVKALTRFVPVGFYARDPIVALCASPNVLLSCGLGGEENESAKDAVLDIIKKGRRPTGKLFVEPSILPTRRPRWVVEASYSDDMFRSCMAAVIRPGIGTVSDAVVARSKIFSFSNSGSYEMSNNGKLLELYGIGEHFTKPLDAYGAALQYIANKSRIRSYLSRSMNLRMDGIIASARFVNINSGGF